MRFDGVYSDFISNPVILYIEGHISGTRFYPKDAKNRPKYYSASQWFKTVEEARQRAEDLRARAIKQAERRLSRLRDLTWKEDFD